jgi:hypothetical protein
MTGDWSALNGGRQFSQLLGMCLSLQLLSLRHVVQRSDQLQNRVQFGLGGGEGSLDWQESLSQDGFCGRNSG